jgi:CheY-like chemotaxis protein
MQTPIACGLRVLAVDDFPDARLLLSTLLGLWGHEVHLAASGPAALQAAAQLRPDVVVLDVGLPGMDGCEVARRLRQTGPADTLLVALTAYTQDRQRCLEAGFDAFLSKPCDPDELQRLLDRWSQSRQRRPARLYLPPCPAPPPSRSHPAICRPFRQLRASMQSPTDKASYLASDCLPPCFP